jgi:hypothetical protein
MMMMSLPAMPPRSHLVDDFGNRADGSLVGQGWSSLGSATNISWTISADGAALSGKKLLVNKTSSDAIRRLSFDAAGSVSDVEVLARVKLLNLPATDTNAAQINIRADSDDGYFANLGDISGTEKSVIAEITGADTSDVLDSANFNYNTTDYVWCRIRMVGTTIQSKHWVYGTSEPAFANSATDASLASGVVALGSYYENNNHEVDYISVAVGGATAPFPAG